MELFIRGRVDNWRIQRLCAYKVVEGWRGSAQMPAIGSFIPLPYDFETGENYSGNDAESIYKEAVANFYNWN